MNIFLYDNTFEGLLTVIFDSYFQKIIPDKIIKPNEQQGIMWSKTHESITDESKAERVWNGLHKKLSADTCQALHKAYLSELQDVELLIFHIAKKAFESEYCIEKNFADEHILQLSQIHRKVVRETQRILMFLRFQKTADDIYFAVFEPKYNVLPLTLNHFESRFSDQKWVVYDGLRNYGFFYDLKTVEHVVLHNSKIDLKTGNMNDSILHSKEKLFQELWQEYYATLCITERKNPKLHKQMLPMRFWKFLPEKNKIKNYSRR